jgi:hypothetical protein
VDELAIMRGSGDDAGMLCAFDGVELVHFALEIIELPVMHLQRHMCALLLLRYAQCHMMVHSTRYRYTRVS